MAKAAAAASTTTTNPVKVEVLESMIGQLLSTKAVGKGSGRNLAGEFERIAKENGGRVTFAQAKEVNPSSPSDLAYYFRAALGKCQTVKQKGGQTYWEVLRLPNGRPGYPSESKQLLADLQAQVAEQQQK